MKEIRTACFLLIIIAGLTSTNTNAQSQCIANAGNDTTHCVEQGFDSYFLGGSPTALGGTPPFSYAWTCTYESGLLTFTEDDFLNDPNTANPQLINFTDDSLVFRLDITDDLGLICTDSITVRFCQFQVLLVDKEATINSGDSVQLYSSTWSNCEPHTIQWTPDYNISDPNDPHPTVWPEISTNYVATVTNSENCTEIDYPYVVNVNPLGVFNNSPSIMGLKIIPHPVVDRSTIELTQSYQGDFQIHFYDSSGRFVKKMKFENGKTELRKDDFKSGMYFYRIIDNDQSVGHGKLVFN